MSTLRRAFLLVAALAASHLQAATHQVTVSQFAFSPQNLTIQAGDTVRWTNQGGIHNVVADDGSFANALGAGWVFEVTFEDAGAFPYYCQAHGGPGGSGMSGQVVVQAVAPPPEPEFTINEGVGGSWYNPATSGQGILLEASSALGLVSMAWFTWTAEGGGYDWLTGVGPFDGDTATIELARSSGGRFDDPAPVTTVAAGTAVLSFTDCGHATFAYTLDGGPTGEIPLQRILPATPACLEANPATAGGDRD